MNKKIIFIVAIIAISAIAGLSIMFSEEKAVSEEPNYDEPVISEVRSGEKIEESISEKFYSKGYLISMNVFLRINQMPLLDDKEALLELRDEIKGFEDSMSSLDTDAYTEEAEKTLENLFNISYAAIEIYEKRLDGDDTISVGDYFSKITEAQTEYLAFAQLFDDKGMKLTAEMIKEVTEITEKFTN